MEENLKKRLALMGQMTREGVFGEKAKQAAKEYLKLPVGIPVFLQFIKDAYNFTQDDRELEIDKITDLFCQLLIVVYRDAKKKNPAVAKSILNSFLEDFPNVDESNLYSKWENLAKASWAFKAASKSQHLLVWQQAINQVLAFNEFLNALLGFLIVGWRCALGKTYSPNVFGNAYGSKLNEFEQLTGGEKGAFYLIFRLANPPLRNAIAHGNIWLDKASGKVNYTDGIKQKKNYELTILDLIAIAAVGVYIPKAYLAALSAIVVLEEGNAFEKRQIPAHLIGVYNHN